MLLLLKPTNIMAQLIADSSANISYNNEIGLHNSLFVKKLAMKRILEKYNSPLKDEVDSFISACQKYDLDCFLLPSISGLESTFGKFILPASHNPFGWGGGYIMFGNWGEGIEAVAKGLRNNYINKGALDIYQIGRIYSESPTWSPRILYFMNEFNKEEQNILLFSSKNRVY